MKLVTTKGDKPGKTAPAAGQFGIVSGGSHEQRAYRPLGCPSPEQFEARFRRAEDPSRTA